MEIDKNVNGTVSPVMKDLELQRVGSKANEPAKYLVLNIYKNGDGIRYQIVNLYTGRVRFKILPKVDPRVKDTINLFLKCVLLMVFTMYTFSGVIVLYIILTPDIRQELADNVALFIIFTLGIFIFMDFVFVCTPFRPSPWNFVFLGITVLSLSTFAGTICSHAQSDVLLYVIVSTSVAVLVAAFLTFTKFDFKSYKLYIVMIGSAFAANVLMVITAASAQTKSAMWCFVLIVFTFIQVGLIVMQLHSILKKKTIKMKEDDYCLGAFMLYASIFDIFVKLRECRTRS